MIEDEGLLGNSLLDSPILKLNVEGDFAGAILRVKVTQQTVL